MNASFGLLGGRAADLRLDFDRTFAEPAQAETVHLVSFLAIRLGAEAFALRLSAISGLYVDKRITYLPGGEAALLGIAGFRGTILPVYSLCALLGLAATDTPRWLVVAADAPVGLAFESFDGHFRIGNESVVPQQNAQRHGFSREFAKAQGQVRPIVDLRSALDSISIRGPLAGTGEER